jgi:hypothetical protein
LDKDEKIVQVDINKPEESKRGINMKCLFIPFSPCKSKFKKARYFYLRENLAAKKEKFIDDLFLPGNLTN